MADDPGATAPAASTDTPAAGAAAPAVETAGPAAAAEQTSLLSGAPATETTPAVTGAETTAAAVPAAAAETPAAATEEVAGPTYTDFTFPEGVSADPELMKGATELFAGDKLSQEQAQRYVDYHTQAIAKRTEQVAQHLSDKQWEDWTKANNTWIKEFESDPDIGGNRKDTTLNEARFAMRMVAGGPEQLKELQTLHDNSGIGNHRREIAAWAEAGRRFQQVLTLTGKDNWNDAIKSLQEPGKPPPGLGPRAPGNNGSRPADRRYGTPSTTRT